MQSENLQKINRREIWMLNQKLHRMNPRSNPAMLFYSICFHYLFVQCIYKEDTWYTSNDIYARFESPHGQHLLVNLTKLLANTLKLQVHKYRWNICEISTLFERKSLEKDFQTAIITIISAVTFSNNFHAKPYLCNR